MKLPTPFLDQENIKQTAALTDRILLDINGIPAWGGNYAHGMCLALDTRLQNVDSEWLMQLCLWLASIRNDNSDSLLLDSGHLYLLRHYNKELTYNEYKKFVNHQIMLVNWISRHYHRTVLMSN